MWTKDELLRNYIIGFGTYGELRVRSSCKRVWFNTYTNVITEESRRRGKWFLIAQYK